MGDQEDAAVSAEETVREAVREFVGDGDGEDQRVLEEYDRTVLGRIDRHALRREIEKIAWGWEEYDGDGAVNFRDDDIDSEKFADRLLAWLTGEKS